MRWSEPRMQYTTTLRTTTDSPLHEKCTWARADIGTPEAQQALTRLACDNSNIASYAPTAAQLLKYRLSDNVGGVKQFSSTLQHALVEARRFALVEAVALLCQPGLARNQ
jgi:hypothetical protein